MKYWDVVVECQKKGESGTETKWYMYTIEAESERKARISIRKQLASRVKFGEILCGSVEKSGPAGSLEKYYLAKFK